MCELLGLAFNEPVTAGISFRGFRHRSASNSHGWGLAWFEDGRASIQKEAAPAIESKAALNAQTDTSISSSIFIGHVRYATCGLKSRPNTHPFHQIVHGRSIVFAHNGTLSGLPQQNHFRLNGETDSEQAFCVFLSWMKEEEVPFSNYAWIEDRLRRMNRLGHMNLLFSNGSELFSYHDMNGYKGLHLTCREAPFPSINLQDEDWTVDLAEEKKPSERGFIIATKPLTDEAWTELERGRLVIQRGRAVYGDPRV